MSASIRSWLLALGILVGALVVGWVIDEVIVRILAIESGPAHRVRGSIARALRGQPEIWSVLFAIALFRPFDFAVGRSLQWIDHLTVVLTVLSVTLFVARLTGWLIRAYLSKDTVAAPSGSIFVNLSLMLIWAIGVTFMLGALNVQIGPLVASLGVVGLAVSLGLQDTLANFFAGLQITMSRQIQPGDYIRLASTEEGAVVDVTWRNTTLRAPSNDLIIVPNSVIARAQLTNFTADDEEHTVVVPFTVAYGSDLEAVKAAAVQVARAVRDDAEGTIRDFEPTCRFRAFGTDGITAAVAIRLQRYQERAPVVSELVERLHAELTAEGFEFGGTAATAPTAPPAKPA